MAAIKIAQPIVEILERSRLDGPTLTLPPSQLDRATYTAVNKVIEAAGGKWSRKDKCHVFEGDAVDTIDPILLTGTYTRDKQEFGQFDTPSAVVTRAVALADIQDGMDLLEPSAGLGNLVHAAELQDAMVTAFEIDERRFKTLTARCRLGGGGYMRDFLTVEPGPHVDRVLMNPPFAKQADIEHVLHAAKFLKPGGRLVAIMSAAVTFRTDRKAEAFRNMLNARGAKFETLDPGAFKESGTMVNAIMVSFNQEG